MESRWLQVSKVRRVLHSWLKGIPMTIKLKLTKGRCEEILAHDVSAPIIHKLAHDLLLMHTKVERLEGERDRFHKLAKHYDDMIATHTTPNVADHEDDGSPCWGGRSPSLHMVDQLAQLTRLTAIVERLPKCWMLNLDGKLVLEHPVDHGQTLYGYDSNGEIRECTVEDSVVICDDDEGRSDYPYSYIANPKALYSSPQVAQAAAAASDGGEKGEGDGH